ncbi:MAG: S4 domain-containing protein, partial [Candidatus Sungiibacteriota bacterium]
RSSRQAISHGHIMVNSRTVRTPSYQTKKGDVVGFTPRAGRTMGFAALGEILAGVKTPPWLALDAGRRTGTITGIPERDLSSTAFDIIKVKEFYSR